QEKQYIQRDSVDTDVIAIKRVTDIVCVELLFIRGGRVIGNKSYFPKIPLQHDLAEALNGFMSQYYLNTIRANAMPKKIITNIKVPDEGWLAAVLSEQFDKKITMTSQVRGVNKQWLNIAETNVNNTLKMHLADKQQYYDRFVQLQQAMQLPSLPTKIECFDVSHSLGEATVASCVVCTQEGLQNADYRRFNIRGVKGGDDYAALEQALTRRYTRLKKAEGQMPDLLLIDGGKGQLHVAEKVLEEIQVSGMMLLSIAKGPGRKPG
ncbi:unnamed protein product, partial [marine sediment metagenome]